MRGLQRLTVFLLLSGCAAAGAGAVEPAATEAWNRVDGPHFTAFTNANRAFVAGLVVDLEKLRFVLIATTENIRFDAPPPLVIYAFKDDWTFRRFRTGPDGRTRRDAGYFLWTPEAQFLAVDTSSIGNGHSPLFHEYLHALLQTNFPRLPTWLDEGLAEYYAAFGVGGRRAEVGRPIPAHLARLSGDLPIPLARLLAITPDSPEYREEPWQPAFYAESWALVHFLLSDPGRREAMGSFCRILGDGGTLEGALAEAFAMDLASFQAGAEAHVRRGTFEFVELKLSKDLEIPRPRATSLSRAEALYRLGDLLARHAPSREEAARDYLLPALARDPSLAGAHQALGYLALVNGRYEEARASLRRAADLEPRNPGTLALLGRATLGALAETGGETGSSRDWAAIAREARAWFRRGLALDPDSVENLAGLGRTFILDPEGASEGITALARAREIAPGRNDLLGDLIVLMARAGNPGGARTLLQALLRPRGDAGQVERAEAAIAASERPFAPPPQP